MLRIIGDINFSDGFFDTGFGVGSKISKGKDPFAKLKRKKEDFWIGNFECVCSDQSVLSGVHAKQFRIAPKSLEHIQHLDLYGVANNHVMQHGEKAYREMIAYFKHKHVLYAGTRDQKSVIFEHQGKKVAFLVLNQRPENFTRPVKYWGMPEYKEISAELEKYKNCDFRIVFIHWGNEFIPYPYNDQKAFAHYLVDSGADLVVGMHPHVLQGFEIYHGKHIFYSIGNCVFNMPWKPTKYAAMVNVDLENNTKVSFDYLKIEDDFFPIVVKTVPEKYSFETLNKFLLIDEENEKYYAHVREYTKQYRKSNHLDIVKNMMHLNFHSLLSIGGDYIKRKIK